MKATFRLPIFLLVLLSLTATNLFASSDTLATHCSLSPTVHALSSFQARQAYESIPALTSEIQVLGGHLVSTPKPDKSDLSPVFIGSVLTLDSGAQYEVERIFSADRKVMKLNSSQRTGDASFLKMSSLPDLVEGKGWPSQILLTLHQMRMAEIPYGGLSAMQVPALTNVRTMLEIFNHPKVMLWRSENPGKLIPADVIADAIPDTQTGRYMQEIAARSGHRVAKIRVDRVGYQKADSVLGRLHRMDRESQKLGQGLQPKMVLPQGFALQLDLEPIRSIVNH